MLLADRCTLKLTYSYGAIMIAGDFNSDLSRNIPMVKFVNSHLDNGVMSSL